MSDLDFSRVFVFEGLDFTGKSSLVSFCKEQLEKLMPGKVSVYRAPGGTELGEKLREIARSSKITVEEQLAVYLASLLSVRVKVKEDIKEGKIVLIDRWFQSLQAYQLEELDNEHVYTSFKVLIEEFKKFESFTGKIFTPSYFILKASLATIEDRLRESTKTDTEDRFELEGAEYRKNIFTNYQKVFKEMAENYYIVNSAVLLDTDKVSLEEAKFITLGRILEKLKQ